MYCENEKSHYPSTHSVTSNTNPITTTQSNAPSSYDGLATSSNGRRQFGHDPLTAMPTSADESLKKQSASAFVPLAHSSSASALNRHNPLSTSGSSANVSSPKQARRPSLSERKLTNYVAHSFSKNIETSKYPRYDSCQETAKTQTDRTIGPSAGNYQHDPATTTNSRPYGSDSRSQVDQHEIIDLTKNNKLTSDMYDDDIDYMNNYLKSLPDYNELNKKINKEYKRCEDIYDKIQTINSGLKNNLLPKSNSYHSICTAVTKPYQQPMAVTQPYAAATPAQNKIYRSTSSTTIPQHLIGTSATDKSDFGQRATAGLGYRTPSQPMLKNGLLKSASNSCINQLDGKRNLNEFWKDNLAKANQQKMGWNYSRIMDLSKDEGGPDSDDDLPPSTGGFKLQKNMSLSQLDQRIRQDLSREELYNLICNNEPTKSPKPTPKLATVKKAETPVQPQAQSKISSILSPLSKSISSSNVPNMLNKSLLKSPRKASIPTFFKPLCKSTSSTHVFNCNYDASKESQETFTPKPLLVKSSSSSSVFGMGQPTAFVQQQRTFGGPGQPSIQPLLASQGSSGSTQAKISRNNELMRANEPIVAKVSTLTEQKYQSKPLGYASSVQVHSQPSGTDQFYVKQNVPQPNKVIVNYPPFKSASTIQVPLNGNLPPAFNNITTTAVNPAIVSHAPTSISTSHPSANNSSTYQYYSTISDLKQPAVATKQLNPPNKSKNEAKVPTDVKEPPPLLPSPQNMVYDSNINLISKTNHENIAAALKSGGRSYAGAPMTTSTTAPMPTTTAISDRNRLLPTGNQPKQPDPRHGPIQARPIGDRRLVHQTSLQYPPMSAAMRTHTNDQPIVSAAAAGQNSVAAYTANILQRSKTHHNINLGGGYQHGNLYQPLPTHMAPAPRPTMPMQMQPMQPMQPLPPDHHHGVAALRRFDPDTNKNDMRSNLNYPSTILKASDGAKATPQSYESLAAVRTTAMMSGGMAGNVGGYNNYDAIAATQPQKVAISHRQSAQLPGATQTTPGMVTPITNQYATPLTTSKSAVALSSKRQSWFANYEAQHQQHQQHIRNMYGTLMRTQSIEEVASDSRGSNNAYTNYFIYCFNRAFAANKQTRKKEKINQNFLCFLQFVCVYALCLFRLYAFSFAAIYYNTMPCSQPIYNGRFHPQRNTIIYIL